MAEQTVYDVIIIGGGPAGASAALYTARADLRTLVLDKSATAGALAATAKIANYPGVPEVISGSELLRRMRRHAEEYGAEFHKARVVAVEAHADPKRVHIAEGDAFAARALILATGSMGRSATIPGEQELLGRGVSYCATCDAAFFRDARVLVVGGGEEAVEEALALTRFAAHVYLAVPREAPDADPDAVAQLLATGRAEILPRTRARRVTGETAVTGAVVTGPDGERTLDVTGVFLYTQGSKPITDYLLGQVETTASGCVTANREGATSVPGIFAAGDLRCTRVEQAVVAAAQGVVAALAVDKYLRGRDRLAKDYR